TALEHYYARESCRREHRATSIEHVANGIVWWFGDAAFGCGDLRSFVTRRYAAYAGDGNTHGARRAGWRRAEARAEAGDDARARRCGYRTGWCVCVDAVDSRVVVRRHAE